jgi:hypothetical protein
MQGLQVHDYWEHAVTCLDTPQQLSLLEQLQAAGFPKSMYMSWPGDTAVLRESLAVLLVPHSTLQQGSTRAQVKLSGQPAFWAAGWRQVPA